MTKVSVETDTRKFTFNLMSVALFAIAFAFVEASVVVYLRDRYYPEGFQFPLVIIPASRIVIELTREFATIVMLGIVGLLAGRKRWERFAFFIIAFGIWDIFYYLWLKLTIDWPASLLDWDILFLLPVPWIGPVIAPVLVSALMIVCGYFIARLYDRQLLFQPDRISWLLAALGTVAILWSFMKDSGVVITENMPEPYSFMLLYVGLVLYVTGFLLSYRRALKTEDRKV